jgi:hypothetical protein
MFLSWLGIVGRIGLQLMGGGDAEEYLPDDPLAATVFHKESPQQGCAPVKVT